MKIIRHLNPFKFASDEKSDMDYRFDKAIAKEIKIAMEARQRAFSLMREYYFLKSSGAEQVWNQIMTESDAYVTHVHHAIESARQNDYFRIKK